MNNISSILSTNNFNEFKKYLHYPDAYMDECFLVSNLFENQQYIFLDEYIKIGSTYPDWFCANSILNYCILYKDDQRINYMLSNFNIDFNFRNYLLIHSTLRSDNINLLKHIFNLDYLMPIEINLLDYYLLNTDNKNEDICKLLLKYDRANIKSIIYCLRENKSFFLNILFNSKQKINKEHYEKCLFAATSGGNLKYFNYFFNDINFESYPYLIELCLDSKNNCLSIFKLLIHEFKDSFTLKNLNNFVIKSFYSEYSDYLKYLIKNEDKLLQEHIEKERNKTLLGFIKFNQNFKTTLITKKEILRLNEHHKHFVYKSDKIRETMKIISGYPKLSDIVDLNWIDTYITDDEFNSFLRIKFVVSNF